jgi:hypothetical protein
LLYNDTISPTGHTTRGENSMEVTKKFCDPVDRYEEGALIPLRVTYTPKGSFREVLITENWRVVRKSIHPEDDAMANYVVAFESVA